MTRTAWWSPPLLCLIVLAACSARPAPSAAPLPLPSASPSGAAATAQPSAAQPSASLAGLPAAGFTRICAVAGDGAGPPFPCTAAIESAIASLGVPAGDVTAGWVRLGFACGPTERCVEPPPGVGHVVTRFVDGSATIVPFEVVDGRVVPGEERVPDWDIWADGTGGSLPTEPPPAERPEVAPGAPAELVDREPFPFCGSEDDIFNRNVRRCFLANVTLGAPAEFLTSVPAADGTLVTTVHRYAGAGPVLVYQDRTHDPDVGAWQKADCAVATVGDDELIFQVTDCIELPLD
jgi:hypothetical protein